MIEIAQLCESGGYVAAGAIVSARQLFAPNQHRTVTTSRIHVADVSVSRRLIDQRSEVR